MQQPPNPSGWSIIKMDKIELSDCLGRPIGHLRTAFIPQRIFLFGSYAKESASPSSDVDLLIIAGLEDPTLINLCRA